MDVRCRKLGCTHNKGQTCTLKTFEINEKVRCADYARDENKPAAEPSKNMFEEKIKFSPFKDIRKFKMHCDATECIFNEKKDCRSNGLTILDKEESCATCCNYFKE